MLGRNGFRLGLRSFDVLCRQDAHHTSVARRADLFVARFRDDPLVLHENAAVTREVLVRQCLLRVTCGSLVELEPVHPQTSAVNHKRNIPTALGDSATEHSSNGAPVPDNPSWQAPFESPASSLRGEGREQSIRVRAVTCRATQVHKRGVDIERSTQAGLRRSPAIHDILQREVSIDAGGQFATDGQYGAYGSYDDVDLSTDAATGSSEVSIDSAEAGVSGYGGAAGGAEFGVDLSVNPLDGVPEIGVDTGFELDADNGFDIGGGYEHVEITQDDGGSVM